MNPARFRNEGWLYTLAFLLAFSLRLLQLGALPLADAEALPALQAQQITLGLKPLLAAHPAYILFTSVLFFLFGTSNFLARFVPALTGSVLVFVPWLFREQLKPRPAVILAFFIAIEPGLLALSRQAASSMLAISFVLFTWGFLSRKSFAPAGFFAALALLSGPALWAGLLGLGITWAIRQALESGKKDVGRIKADGNGVPVESDPLTNRLQSTPPGALPAINIKQLDVKSRNSFLTTFLVTLLSAGTLLFLAPNGLSAALASLTEYLLTWGRASSVPPGRLLFSLAAYQPLGLLLAILAGIRGWRAASRRIIPLSLWLIIALLLVLFNPSRQVADLGWTLIPLYSLAALELARYSRFPPEERRDVAGLILLTLLILVFAWLDLAGLNWSPIPSPQASVRIWLLFGALFLLMLIFLLVAAGWSMRIARLGGMWGVCIALAVYTLASALGAAGLHGSDKPELWWLAGRPAQTELLTETAAQLSEWSTGADQALQVVIAGLDSPSLEWALRFHPITRVDTLDAASSPPIVITPVQENPGLAASYRGQDFVWRQTPAWASAQFGDWLRWITLRQMPATGESIILWARNDLFLDARSIP